MAQTGRLINQQSTWELNLTVLQRMDSQVEEILITAGHVTLYEFDVDKNQWSRKDVEGPLFVVKWRNKPRFQFIVMNRRSTANLVENLLDGFEYEVQVPYLLYRNADQEVNGIWFYNPRECEEVARLFSRILNAYSKAPAKRNLVCSSDEFQELEAVPTPATVEGPLEPTSNPVAVGGVCENPLERFFSNGLHLNPLETRAYSTSSTPVAIVHSSSSHASNISAFSPMHAMPPPPLPPPPLAASETLNKSPESPLKPYFFVPPPLPSSQPSMLHPPPTLQPSVGAPILQPFPPPAPPPSLAPPVANPLSRSGISKEAIRDTLYRLLQNDNFIDMIHEEILKSYRGVERQ